MGTTLHLRTIMLRPAKLAGSAPAGNASDCRSSESKWWGVSSNSNQNALICVNTRPLSGIGVGSTQSKALIRSELIINSRSPRS